MTHNRYYIAYYDPDDYPQIEEGPFYMREDVYFRLEEFSSKGDYVVLQGDFPDEG